MEITGTDAAMLLFSRRLIPLIVLLICGVLLCSVAAAETQQEKAQVFRDLIAKQVRNVQLMQQELKDNPDHPDAKKLGNFYATAAGARTQSYREEPPYVRALIDKLEKDKALITQNAITLGQHLNNVAYGHFLVEIDRSKKFIAMLRKELRNTETQPDIPTSTVQVPDSNSPLPGKWKYVGGDYVIQIEGEDGELKAVIEKSTKPDPNLPYDYTVGSTMFEKGKRQADGSYNIQWAQYTWENSNVNHRLKRGVAPAILRLRPDKEAFVITGKNREYSPKSGAERWLDTFGSQFKFSFIKLE